MSVIALSLLAVAMSLTAYTIYLDKWMLSYGKLGTFLGWASVVIFGVVPILLDPILAIISLPFLLINLKHSWINRVTDE